jgi:hypothetical protein
MGEVLLYCDTERVHADFHHAVSWKLISTTYQSGKILRSFKNSVWIVWQQKVQNFLYIRLKKLQVIFYSSVKLEKLVTGLQRSMQRCRRGGGARLGGYVAKIPPSSPFTGGFSCAKMVNSLPTKWWR